MTRPDLQRKDTSFTPALSLSASSSLLEKVGRESGDMWMGLTQVWVRVISFMGESHDTGKARPADKSKSIETT